MLKGPMMGENKSSYMYLAIESIKYTLIDGKVSTYSIVKFYFESRAIYL